MFPTERQEARSWFWMVVSGVGLAVGLLGLLRFADQYQTVLDEHLRRGERYAHLRESSTCRTPHLRLASFPFNNCDAADAAATGVSPYLLAVAAGLHSTFVCPSGSDIACVTFTQGLVTLGFPLLCLLAVLGLGVLWVLRDKVSQERRMAIASPLPSSTSKGWDLSHHRPVYVQAP